MDEALIGVARAALELAGQARAPWPGYEAAARPLVIYRAGVWSILVNPPGGPAPAGWRPYPDSWPRLPRPAWLDADGDPGLVGQLAFDYEVPGGLAVAIPLYEDLPAGYGSRDLYLYGFLVHEAFHQFQRHRFADVETPSEERYPMLDAENNALAGMELRALKEAVEAAGSDDAAAVREAAVLALTVREARWSRLDESARAIERSKEVVEGTAKYVETRWVAALAAACRSGRLTEPGRLCESATDQDAVTWLGYDFDTRMTGGAIAPEDMARNRIYPAAAAVALLLDRYEPDWKFVVEREGTRRGLFEHLASVLAVPPAERTALLDRARARYGWLDLVRASETLVAEYLSGFERALSTFEAEPGVRVVVRVPTNGVSRSRSSRERRWVVDEGRRTLGRFVVYTLRRRAEPTIELSLENAWLMDDVFEEGYRTVTFHARGAPSVTVDGERIALGRTARRRFGSLALEADGAVLRSGLGGMLVAGPEEIRIDIEPGKSPGS